jgi:hypothetical protein
LGTTDQLRFTIASNGNVLCLAGGTLYYYLSSNNYSTQTTLSGITSPSAVFYGNSKFWVWGQIANTNIYSVDPSTWAVTTYSVGIPAIELGYFDVMQDNAKYMVNGLVYDIVNKIADDLTNYRSALATSSTAVKAVYTYFGNNGPWPYQGPATFTNVTAAVGHRYYAQSLGSGVWYFHN